MTTITEDLMLQKSIRVGLRVFCLFTVRFCPPLVFGVFVVVIVFGDSHLNGYVGNLDTIFGVAYWKLLDVFYSFGAIAVFLLYGKVKGGLKISVLTIVMFLSFLVALALIDLDDIVLVLNLNLVPIKSYWVVVELFFPVYSVIAFFVFGKANQVGRIAD